MATKARGLRLSKDLEEEIEREMRLRGATFSEVAAGLLREAVRMRRVPGIVFMEGPAGRRASLAGTGLDVWEVVSTFGGPGNDTLLGGPGNDALHGGPGADRLFGGPGRNVVRQ